MAVSIRIVQVRKSYQIAINELLKYEIVHALRYESSKSGSKLAKRQIMLVSCLILILLIAVRMIILLSADNLTVSQFQVAFGVLYANGLISKETPVAFTTTSTTSNSIESKMNLERPIDYTTTEMIHQEEAFGEEENNTLDTNAEKLISVASDVPKTYLIPPPPPLHLNPRRKQLPPQRRRFEEERFPRPFNITRKRMKPVNSIQDIIHQMESESNMNFNRPKRINFYGRYKQRPNRPQIIPVHGDSISTYSPSKPSVASDVNLLANNHIASKIARKPPQLYHPNLHSGVYDQIIATNKKRQEITKNAKPFSLMLDIYPMNNDKEDVSGIKINQQQQHAHFNYPQYVDNSYYDSIKFPQINPYYHQTPTEYSPPPLSSQEQFGSPPNSNSNDKPGKMVVHLNLYPTKKNRKIITNDQFADQKFDSNMEEEFVPMVNPQVYFHSKSTDDINNHFVLNNISSDSEIVEIPKRNAAVPFRIIVPPTTTIATTEVEFFKSIELGPAINITDFRTTIPPDVINNAIFNNQFTQSSSFYDTFNEISKRRVDHQDVYHRNSHQPDNPMIVASYLRAIATTVQPHVDDTINVPNTPTT